jgi:hypothetical protein
VNRNDDDDIQVTEELRKNQLVEVFRPLTTKDIWQRGFKIVKGTYQTIIPIAIIGMLLPQLILIFHFDSKAEEIVKALRDTAYATSGSFNDTLQLAYSFAGPFVLAALALWCAFLTAYMALLHAAVHFSRTGLSLNTYDSFKKGLMTALTGGIVLTFALLLIAIIGQVFIGSQFLAAPAIIVAALSLMAPVLMVAEKKRALKAVYEAVMLRYLRGRKQVLVYGKKIPSGLSGWNVMFMLLVQGSFFYAMVNLVTLASSLFVNLDDYISIPNLLWSSWSAWISPFSGYSFGMAYVFATVFESTLSFAIISFLPAVTTALYFLAAGKREIASV